MCITHLAGSKQATDTHPILATAIPAGVAYCPQLPVPSALPEAASSANVFAGVVFIWLLPNPLKSLTDVYSSNSRLLTYFKCLKHVRNNNMSNSMDGSGRRKSGEWSFGRKMVVNSLEWTSRQFLFCPYQRKLSPSYLNILKILKLSWLHQGQVLPDQPRGFLWWRD